RKCWKCSSIGIIFAIGCRSPFQEWLLLVRQSQLTPSRFSHNQTYGTYPLMHSHVSVRYREALFLPGIAAWERMLCLKLVLPTPSQTQEHCPLKKAVLCCQSWLVASALARWICCKPAFCLVGEFLA